MKTTLKSNRAVATTKGAELSTYRIVCGDKVYWAWHTDYGYRFWYLQDEDGGDLLYAFPTLRGLKAWVETYG